MNRTDIEWCFGGYTWNPTRGCSMAGVDCANCYAMGIAGRYHTGAFKGFARQTPKGARWTGKLAVVDDKLTEPIREIEGGWMFVNSMSDLFHDKLKDSDIDPIVTVILLCTHHRSITLTKRVDRMGAYFTDPTLTGRLRRIADDLRTQFPRLAGVAIPDIARDGLPKHTWWGMSAGNQDTFDERYAGLLQVPGLRLLSLEPLIGKIFSLRGLARAVDWVIVGGESGPGRRPGELDWVRGLRDEVLGAQGIASRKPTFFFKQWPIVRCRCVHPRKWHGRDGCDGCGCTWIGTTPEPGLQSSHPVGSNTQILSLPFLDGQQWCTPPKIHATGISS